MRVVMLLGRSTGGIGTHVAELTAELRLLGDDVVVVTDELTATRFDLAGARRWWPRLRRTSGGSLRETVRNLVRLRQLVRGADLVHAHGHQAGLLATLVSASTGTPVVVSQHNAVLATRHTQQLVSALVQRVVARHAALVTGASTDLVAQASRFGARDSRLAPVPSPRVPGLLARPPLTVTGRAELAAELLLKAGVTKGGVAKGGVAKGGVTTGGVTKGAVTKGGTDSVAAYGVGEYGTPRRIVLTVSRIARQKNLETLIAAAALVGEGVSWVVVGDGDDALLSQYRHEAERVSAPVHFVGSVPDPSDWLRAAEVFALPSRWEARALVVQEAMAAGTPVVASATGGLSDLVDGAGILVPVGDAAALARSVRDLLEDSQRRGQLSQLGRDRATSWDDGRSTARRWHQWYSAASSMT
ncbi:MAG TPA: glycosyltransferase family 4 protein [Pedococcus sp.]|nr:glycosyltransferase family 4 protein [Pedococcus sp.]